MEPQFFTWTSIEEIISVIVVQLYGLRASACIVVFIELAAPDPTRGRPVSLHVDENVAECVVSSAPRSVHCPCEVLLSRGRLHHATLTLACRESVVLLFLTATLFVAA